MMVLPNFVKQNHYLKIALDLKDNFLFDFAVQRKANYLVLGDKKSIRNLNEKQESKN